ncbi:MAG: MFS transporter, partial [Muribaculaceae bacterium]|nr:MFS transporter [Muribaculaceae bacterium]
MVLVMTVLDVTIVNVALPVLASDFGISNSSAVWLITVYQLIITMLLLPASSFGDRFSYRSVFLTGTLIFTIASIACASSPSFGWLLASRTFQGIGAACVMGVNIALTRLIYPRNVLGRGMALNAMVIAISTAAGPTIAGSLLSVASWHWLFLINIPFGVAAFIIGKKLLPLNPLKNSVTDSSRSTGKSIIKGYDWISALENMLVFGIIFLALGLFSRNGDLSLGCGLLTVGIALGNIYIRRQNRIEDPMFPVDLFRSRLFSLSIFTSVASFIAQNVAMISLPFLFHNRYGFSEIITGLLMTPWSIATMIISPLAARFVEKHNPELTAACGMGVYALGLVSLLLLPDTGAQPWQIAWRMALCGVGFGMFQTPNNIVMVIATPLQRSGSAGGMQGTARLVGQTLGATIVTLVFAVTSMEISISATLFVALAFALIAATFSFSRNSSKSQKI